MTSDLRSLPKLNELCKTVDDIILEQHQAVIKEKKAKLKTFYDVYNEQLSGYLELQDELKNIYDSILKLIDTSTSITNTVLAADGFESRADALLKRIPAPPEPPSPPKPGPGPSPVKPSPARGSFYVKLGSTKIHIDSEDDIESYLDDLRKEMKKKLNEGSFDIKW